MHTSSEPHARHDRHLVAALAAGDLEPIARTEAEALVSTCDDCAELFADLKLIAAATAALPDVPRTRDFRITAADAARLRPRGWRALVDAIGGARAGFTRPLAAGLTTLGLVGLLVTTIPGALSGQAGASSSAAPDDGARYSYASAAPASAAAAPAAGQGVHASPPVVAFGPSAAASAAASLAQVDTGAPAATRDSVEAVGTAAPAFGGNVQPPGTKGGRGTGAGATASGGATTDESTTGALFASNIGERQLTAAPDLDRLPHRRTRPVRDPLGSPAARSPLTSRRRRADGVPSHSRHVRGPLAGTLTVSERHVLPASRGSHGTPDAARRQRAHLPRLFRAPTAHDVAR